jgi:hypothetical protein
MPRSSRVYACISFSQERQERNVETAYHAEEDLDNGGGSGGEELLRRLDSLFRGVLTKRFGRKVSKAFFIHVFPLVEEFLKEEEGELRSSAQDRQDRYQGGAGINKKMVDCQSVTDVKRCL